MVGLTIGMLVSVVILQVLSVFEAQKRTTTGTADAQTNGSIALFNIGRELQQAGYPLMPVTNSALECTAVTVGGSAGTIAQLSPATLADGVATTGVSASDTITLRYGDTAMGGVPTQTTGNPTASAGTAAPARDVAVLNNFGCQINDAILITKGTSCAISTVVALPAGTTSLTFSDETNLDKTDAKTLVTAATAAPTSSGTNLACLGAWHEVTYHVFGGNLERCDTTETDPQTSAPSLCDSTKNSTSSPKNAGWKPTVTGVVNIQAQYGISAAANSNQVVQWVNAKNLADWVVGTDGTSTGVDWGTGLTLADRNRIKAIRIAVVARNAKMEVSNVTTACSSTTSASPTGLCSWPGTVASPAPMIDLSQSDSNWQRYRYRVFENIIPLRNMIWSKDTL